MKKRFYILFTLLWISTSVFGAKNPLREMRAVWIATVDNIDWPSKPGLSTDQQKKEFVEMLDRLKAIGMNTVIFQIRPAADALYSSKYEPWSQSLSGIQGIAPEPFYDPLQFAIEQCHQRSMELHAWMNPYRAVFLYESTKTAKRHITNLHPEWFISYGKHRYFDPGLQATRNYVSKIVADVVRRYDVDAIHFDDYFYPYKIDGVNFPDSVSFRNEGGDFYPDRIDDWRRENVNQVIHQINDSIKSIKPYLPFGISPFGVWRNKSVDKKGSKTQAGQTNYDDLYADVLLWLREGWIDYIAPQIYWHIGKKVANYRSIAKWWNKNAMGKPCYIGQGVYRLNKESGIKSWRNPHEIVRQVNLNRRLKSTQGSMFFSARNFMENRLGINQQLSKMVFQSPAIIPENPLFKGEVPSSPILKQEDGKLIWTRQPKARYYVVYGRKERDRKVFCITNKCEWSPERRNGEWKFSVTAVNRGHFESENSNESQIE